jgi:predicted glycosyltransferase
MGILSKNGGPVRVMMYSHDGFGLGHLRRNSVIAAQFTREVPGSSVLMVIGCPSGTFFQTPPGVDSIKVPSVIKVDTGAWSPRTLHISPDTTKALRAATIRQAAELFVPHLFLVDYIPTGVWGELQPTLQMLKRRQDPPKIILGLRDILDDPEVTRKLWRQQGAYEAIDRYYDKVFIYGCREVFDTAAQYGLDSACAEKVEECGYLCSLGPYKAKAQMRAELQTKRDKLVVVTAGGGHDAYPMMLECIEAFHHFGKESPVEAIFIGGPLMAGEQRESLRRRAEGLPIRVLWYVEDGLSCMNAADLVITMAGYNTLTEAIHLGKRVLVVPRQGPSAEQTIRAQRFSDLGLVQAIRPEQLSPAVLARAIWENLYAHAVRPLHLRMDGLTHVVRNMTRLLPLGSGREQ